MAGYAIKYVVYFPKLYSWLLSKECVDVTDDIAKAVMFDEMSDIERVCGKLGIGEAMIQKYKATLTMSDSFHWRAVR